MGKIVINITKEDKVLFDFLKRCRNEEIMKDSLKSVVELYTFSSGDIGELIGYKSPEKYKEELKNCHKTKLLKTKDTCLDNLLLYTQEYHPDVIDCGVFRGPDDDYWFIDDGGVLGHISLYSQYIKVIDELLDDIDQK